MKAITTILISLVLIKYTTFSSDMLLLNISYSLDYRNLDAKHNEVVLTAGIIQKAPQYFFNESLFNVGLGGLIHGEEMEYIFNFSLFKIITEQYITLSEESHLPYSDFSIGFDFTRYSIIQFGVSCLDYQKNLLYDRKANWVDFSADVIIDKRNWKGHYSYEEYNIDYFKFQSVLSVNCGVSNIIYSDLLSKFPKQIRNNHFGFNSGFEGILGCLINSNLFVGAKGKISVFISDMPPFIEQGYGVKFYYFIPAEESNTRIARNLGLFLNITKDIFTYKKLNMNFIEAEIGIKLFLYIDYCVPK